MFLIWNEIQEKAENEYCAAFRCRYSELSALLTWTQMVQIWIRIKSHHEEKTFYDAQKNNIKCYPDVNSGIVIPNRIHISTYGLQISFFLPYRWVCVVLETMALMFLTWTCTKPFASLTGEEDQAWAPLECVYTCSHIIKKYSIMFYLIKLSAIM